VIRAVPYIAFFPLTGLTFVLQPVGAGDPLPSARLSPFPARLRRVCWSEARPQRNPDVASIYSEHPPPLVFAKRWFNPSSRVAFLSGRAADDFLGNVAPLQLFLSPNPSCEPLRNKRFIPSPGGPGLSRNASLNKANTLHRTSGFFSVRTPTVYQHPGSTTGFCSSFLQRVT